MEIAVTVLAVGLLIFFMVRKVRKGGSCCGEHEGAPKKIKPADTNKANYPYRYSARIDGMVCSNCLRRVENAFNSADGIYARGGNETGTVRVLAKRPITRREAAEMLGGTPYTLLQLTEEKYEAK